jgi:integrase
MDTIELHCGRGRKYLTQAERKAFYRVASGLSSEQASLCLLLLFTGCRISEALMLTPEHVDYSDGTIIFETLKRRRSGVFRGVPVPRELLTQMPVVGAQKRIWPISRVTAYRLIKGVMMQAGIEGAHACPKGLRHAFGIACAERTVPITVISYWMGHANVKTTGIYLTAVGEEERRLAGRVWSQFNLSRMVKKTARQA